MGPLSGIRVIEMAGLGPGPMAGMLLADMGADVIRVERAAAKGATAAKDVSLRGKSSIALDLKKPQAVAALLRLIGGADALLEGFRPGVMERLGVGPDACMERNPRLVYGRMTGWGQDGPLAHAAGHDINYIALTGALFAMGRNGERPIPPLNLVGDMGGGGMLLAFGIVCAILESRASGKGQVVDAAMVDGSALLMWMVNSLHASGRWNTQERGSNLLDGGAHFYDTYETSDKKYVAVGAIEPAFYAKLLQLVGVDPQRFADQHGRQQWPLLRGELARVFKTKSRDEWCRLMEGTDACFAPVLSLDEAPDHPHNRARGSYVSLDGFVQPAPAPRFSRTSPKVRHGAQPAGADGATVLDRAGFSGQEIAELRRVGALLELQVSADAQS